MNIVFCKDGVVGQKWGVCCGRAKVGRVLLWNVVGRGSCVVVGR